MNDCEDLYDSAADPVNDAEIAVKDFANVVAFEFRNDSARLGEAASRRSDSLAPEELALNLCVGDDIATVSGFQAASDFRKEIQPFHHVLDGCIVGNVFNRLSK